MKKLNQLYRYYDKDGNLLYVGISISAIVRMSQHRTQSSWFPLAKWSTFENFTSREEVLKAEVQAIINENPIYNINHNKGSEDVKLKRVIRFNKEEYHELIEFLNIDDNAIRKDLRRINNFLIINHDVNSESHSSRKKALKAFLKPLMAAGERITTKDFVKACNALRKYNDELGGDFGRFDEPVFACAGRTVGAVLKKIGIDLVQTSQSHDKKFFTLKLNSDIEHYISNRKSFDIIDEDKHINTLIICLLFFCKHKITKENYKENSLYNKLSSLERQQEIINRFLKPLIAAGDRISKKELLKSLAIIKKNKVEIENIFGEFNTENSIRPGSTVSHLLKKIGLNLVYAHQKRSNGERIYRLNMNYEIYQYITKQDNIALPEILKFINTNYDDNQTHDTLLAIAS